MMHINYRAPQKSSHNSHTASAFCCGKLLRRFKTCVHERHSTFSNAKKRTEKTAVNYSLIASTMSWELSTENSTHTPHCTAQSFIHVILRRRRFSVWDTGISTFHFPLFASNFTSFLWWRRAIKKFIKLSCIARTSATVGWGVGDVEVYRVNL